jgi:hypothetical protein
MLATQETLPNCYSSPRCARLARSHIRGTADQHAFGICWRSLQATPLGQRVFVS